jgi:K+-transporting ATPase ATPase A chain
MLLFAILAVFVAGLMVGRTPEYLGKKIEAREVKSRMLAILVLPLAILGFTARCACPAAGRGVDPGNAGPHGFSEILYALHVGGGQQRLGLRGLHRQHALLQHHARHRDAARPLRLSSSRCWPIAGSLAAKRSAAASAGTFPTHGPLFVGLLVGVILIVGGLTFFPALALGPIAEHFAMLAGTTF